MIDRSVNQIEANKLDLDLYRVMAHAERASQHPPLSVEDRERWAQVAHWVKNARAPLRRMMNSKDAEATNI